MAVVHFVGHFVASNFDVLGVDDNNVITVISMWGIGNFAFTHELISDDDSKFA